jgi:hypothetical protein
LWPRGRYANHAAGTVRSVERRRGRAAKDLDAMDLAKVDIIEARSLLRPGAKAMRGLGRIDANAVDHEDRFTSAVEAVCSAKTHARSGAGSAARAEHAHAGDARREQVGQCACGASGDRGGVDDAN